MANKQANDGAAGREASRAGRRAWRGRVMLALVPLAVLVATGHQMMQLRAEERWREFSVEFRRTPLPETRQAIDAGVEAAFAPVYAAIPSLLDWHYSFIGQYAELGLALTGRLEEEIESRLFGELEEGTSLAVADVGRVMQEEVLTEIERWFGREMAALPSGQGAPGRALETLPSGQGAPGRALETLLEDARRHFVVSVGPTAVGAAMAGVRTSAGVKILTRGLAEKLAGGAALRAAGPIMGRAAGFIVAAAAGVGIDIALRKLDELLNRDELEQALTALVDEEKERVKAALESAVDEVKVTALGDFVPSRLR